MDTGRHYKNSILSLSFRSRTVFLILMLAIPLWVSAQSGNQWSLDKCMSYALENSMAVKQKSLELETQKIRLQATKLNMLPALEATIGQNIDFGMATTSSALKISNNQTRTSLGINMQMSLFEGLRTYHQIASDKLGLQALLYDLENAKENVKLLVTAYYLQVLLNQEYVKMMQEQEQLTTTQIDRIQQLVENGKCAESELYTVKATYANDHLSVVDAQNNLRLAKLDLAQLINYPSPAEFDIVPIDISELFAQLLDKSADIRHILDFALTNRPAVKSALLRIEQNKKAIQIYRAGWYPKLYLYASYGTGYFYMFNDNPLYPNSPFFTQFNRNSQEVLGLSLNVPLFDRLATYHNVKLAKVSVLSAELQLEESKRNLIKEIEQAYTNAVTSKEKYRAAEAAEAATKIAFEYEEIKFNAGSSTNYEFNDAKTKYLKAQSQLLQSKFDFLFRVMILEFYGKNENTTN